ncbi:RNA polymerase sigma factor [Pseudocolwellia sp. HL-MZ7]|uniref:RNA polymerase sigma factor n=1 Tax=Pseudocolwellia sp. HL-MZ7 TaxID=3400627 RepID=UPI003CEE961B
MSVVYITQCKDRKNNLLESLIDKYESDIMRFLRVRLALEADRDDIIQDLMIRLLRIENLEEKLMMEGSNAKSYLLSIAANLVKDLYRRKLGRGEQSDDALANTILDNGNPEQILSHQQTLTKVSQVLESVKPIQKEAFLLNRLENKSYRQISEEMGVSVSTIERHISKVLLALRLKVVKK